MCRKEKLTKKNKSATLVFGSLEYVATLLLDQTYRQFVDQLISEGNFGVIPATSIKPKPQSARKEAREAGFLVYLIIMVV